MTDSSTPPYEPPADLRSWRLTIGQALRDAIRYLQDKDAPPELEEQLGLYRALARRLGINLELPLQLGAQRPAEEPGPGAGRRPDHATPPVPPGSTPCRELLHAIGDALTLPAPATHADEVSYFRLRSQRATQALTGIRRVVDNREADSADMLAEAEVLREAIADLPPDTYEHNGLST